MVGSCRFLMLKISNLASVYRTSINYHYMSRLLQDEHPRSQPEKGLVASVILVIVPLLVDFAKDGSRTTFSLRIHKED